MSTGEAFSHPSRGLCHRGGNPHRPCPQFSSRPDFHFQSTADSAPDRFRRCIVATAYQRNCTTPNLRKLASDSQPAPIDNESSDADSPVQPPPEFAGIPSIGSGVAAAHSVPARTTAEWLGILVIPRVRLSRTSRQRNPSLPSLKKVAVKGHT
ncbi:hypothetical protein EJ04DRAFT_156597 [Polyplosphaeria fusca]|uniref:Uncharacterized protein n=1 Tax=Polyplosphaeria fusca TaxID=682080 RepID=A0A9P4R3T3_9PLEO|nr:hypothetical protein EJ04DRAFT_156597 [Polyplosphaeria fusca]